MALFAQVVYPQAFLAAFFLRISRALVFREMMPVTAPR
jgi:hypothetical protein